DMDSARVPAPGQQVYPDGPSGRHSFTRSPQPGRLCDPQPRSRRLQAVYSVCIRGSAGDFESVSEASARREVFFDSLHASSNAQSREPVVSLGRATGRLRIPLRAREHIEIQLSVSAWHHRFLEDPEWELGSLTVVPGKILLVVRMVRPKTYEPPAAIALDTNEDSLDGVIASDGSAACVIITLGGIRQVQEVHFRRRRKLARKKANDRRVKQKLLRREGLRERHRVLQRLHRTSKAIVSLAEQRKAAVVLEDLTLHATRSHSQRMNRRLSSWPRGEIHRQ